MSNNILDDFQLDLSGVGVGPRGGDMNNPILHPERRKAEFNGELVADGIFGLQRHKDSAHHGIGSEKGWHRMAVYMVLENRSNKEIAGMAGVTEAQVSVLRQQKWFQELVVLEAKDSHAAVQATLQGHALDAVETLVDLMKTSESDRVQATCAIAVLEHAHGKAVQRVHSIHEKGQSFSNPKDERDSLLQQLKDLRAARAAGRGSDIETVSESPNGADVSNE